MQGVSFDNMSPTLEGWWYNSTTQDCFEVRDTYFEDNKFTVATMDGRLIDYDRLSSYVKVDATFAKNIKNNKGNVKHDDKLPTEVESLIAEDMDILDDDMQMIQGMSQPQALGNINNGVKYVEAQPTRSTDQIIVERFLSNKTTPIVNVDVDWKDFPKNEINMLMNADVNIEEIVKWYVERTDTQTLTRFIQSAIRAYIFNQIEEEKEDCEDTVDEKPKKKSGGKKEK